MNATPFVPVKIIFGYLFDDDVRRESMDDILWVEPFSLFCVTIF